MKRYCYLLVSIFVILGYPAHGQLNIITVAGDGTAAYAGDGGPASAAELQYPFAVVTDANGNIYLTDLFNSVVRKIDNVTGTINLVAGTLGASGGTGDGGPALAAYLNNPTNIYLDGVGDMFITDQGNNRIRKVTGATGIITTIAGNGTPGYAGDNGPATGSELNQPFGATMDDTGNIYIADYGNSRIRKIHAATGIITTVAGIGIAGFSGDGSVATLAKIDSPTAIAVDHHGNIFIADYRNARVRMVEQSTGIITTYAGTGVIGYTGDGGPASAARLSPIGLSLDSAGNVLIADQDESSIRIVTAATGIISTVAGTGAAGFSGDGGPATSAKLNYPTGVTSNAAGDVFYIADKLNNRIRKVYQHSAGLSALPLNDNIIFPNPSSGRFTILRNNNELAYIEIFNALGVMICRSSIAGPSEKIDISSQPAGFYFLHFISPDNTEILKLRLEK